MITIKAEFDKNATAYTSKVPDTKFGNDFDGVNYYYFESEQELEEYYKKLDNGEGNTNN